MKLRTLVRADRWHAHPGPGSSNEQSVAECLTEVESSLGLDFTDQSHLSHPAVSPFVTNLRTHALIIGVLYFTLIGSSIQSSARLKKLHEILDANAAEGNESDTDNGYFSVSPVFIMVR